MRKSLTTICALLLVAGATACSRGSGNGSDDDRLNAAATQQDNAIYDTSADDMTANVVDAGEGNAAAAAPANASAPAGNSTGNRQ